MGLSGLQQNVFNSKMSRNNLILVIYRRSSGTYHVVPNANADTDWSCMGAIYILFKDKKAKFRFTRNRATALILAHNMQKRLYTEYGVHEVTVGYKHESILRKLRRGPICDQNSDDEFVFI